MKFSAPRAGRAFLQDEILHSAFDLKNGDPSRNVLVSITDLFTVTTGLRRHKITFAT
jgi:hypothetical protein